MERKAVRRFAVLSVFLWLLPSAGMGVVVPTAAGQSRKQALRQGDEGQFEPPAALAPQRLRQVDCDQARPGALQRAVDRARPGDTILVSGTCYENLSIPVGKDRITLDGGGNATIHGPDATLNTILVRGSGITITAFTITGGRAGIDVGRGGTAVIDGNTIDGTGRFGITVGAFGSANIVNNTIQNNASHGILLTGNSFAFIAFRTADDTVASPNIIRNNGIHGINVVLSASARIAGNTISDNVRNGVSVTQASHAIISDNAIDGNGQHGIFVSENSGVNLGSDMGAGIFDRPNATTMNNGLNGINCRVGGYGNGRLGTLNGNNGPKDFGTSCIDSLDTADTF